jgi:hypothetical protein
MAKKQSMVPQTEEERAQMEEEEHFSQVTRQVQILIGIFLFYKGPDGAGQKILESLALYADLNDCDGDYVRWIGERTPVNEWRVTTT